MTVVIGIAGGTAAGKSTLAELIEQALADMRVLNVAMDSYFKPAESAPQVFSTRRGEPVPDRNHPDSADLPRLCADVDAAIVGNAFELVIIQGLMTLHDPEVRQRCDLKLFVETPDDLRLYRRIRRIQDRRPEAALEDIAGYYFDSAYVGHREYVGPSRRHADIVFPGDREFTLPVALLAAWVRDQVFRAAGSGAT